MTVVSDQTIIEAYVRQDGVCAICGESLDECAYEAHHLRRSADGGSDSVDNIALLCDRDEHEYMHGGNFRAEIETTPDHYPYFYGKSDQLEYKEDQKDDVLDSVDDCKEIEFDEEINDNYNEGGIE